MQEGRCAIHGTYFTDLLIGCPTCWASRAEQQWCCARGSVPHMSLPLADWPTGEPVGHTRDSL